jgi:hypothetical protein
VLVFYICFYLRLIRAGETIEKEKSGGYFLITSVMVSGTSVINPVVADPDPMEFWALIVCGSYDFTEPNFAADAAFMYHVLSINYTFDGIYYLHADARALKLSTPKILFRR